MKCVRSASCFTEGLKVSFNVSGESSAREDCHNKKFNTWLSH